MVVENVAKTTRKYGKHDLERLGIFIEMPYMNEKYKKQLTNVGEGLRSMLPGGNLIKCGNMDGYFDDEFKRIFKGEYAKKKKEKKFDSSKLPFMPAAPGKKHSGNGDYYGTFSGVISEFSPKLRKEPKAKPSKPNPITNPAKKGGPGYIGITIGKFPEYV